jgi:hypothetical protein
MAIARQERPDLIRMDVQLPKVSGIEATRTLRGEPATAKTPIIQEVRLELQQKGAKVLGSFAGAFLGGSFVRGSLPLAGSAAGDVFTFKDSRGSLSGELTVSGDEMRGQGLVGNSRPVKFDLRRIDASPPSAPPTR